MKLTVLVDNNTLTDRYFLGEPGVSYLLEEGPQKILFDLGYSDAFLINARKLDQNLRLVDRIVLSHAHLDHTWGLEPLLRLFGEGKIESLPHSRPVLLAHPLIFDSRTEGDLGEIGMNLSREQVEKHFTVDLRREPVWLSDRLVYLGEIERIHDFENRTPVGLIHRGGEARPDFLLDDTALAYRSGQGLVIITGCSHSGICNIIDYARRICGEERVADVIGGFHLLNPSREQMAGTLDYFKKLRPSEIHACHCVDLASRIALAGAADLKEVGAGLSLIFH